MSRQKLGQHFLTDAIWRARILQAVDIHPADVWLEIGAGHGEMTGELARRAGRVVAIELDSRLAESLSGLASKHPSLEVVRGNVLELDLARLAGSRFKVYGNLPYYITSPILHRLFEFVEQVAEIAVVIQLEVAARLVARPGRRAYGYLSVLTQFYTNPEIALRIPPGAFRPQPRVASALVLLRPPGERRSVEVRDEARFFQFVQACFALKRKTLLNNLRRFLRQEKAAALLDQLGLGRSVRAEQLTLRQFAELFCGIAPQVVWAPPSRSTAKSRSG